MTSYARLQLPANAHAPARVVQARAGRDIGKRSVAPVAVKARGRAVAVPPVLESGAIHQEEVGEAVVVVVDPRHTAAAFGLDDVALLRPAAGQLEVDTGFSRDFDELIELSSLLLLPAVTALRLTVVSGVRSAAPIQPALINAESMAG